MVLHGILRNNWETFIKALVAAKLFTVWNSAYKNLLHAHWYHILRLYVEIPAAGAKAMKSVSNTGGTSPSGRK